MVCNIKLYPYNSNTTLVKVKYHSFKNRDEIFSYSNTTLVKVKWITCGNAWRFGQIQIQHLLKLNKKWENSLLDVNKFKYNTC